MAHFVRRNLKDVVSVVDNPLTAERVDALGVLFVVGDFVSPPPL
jgi:hypothetical protein